MTLRLLPPNSGVAWQYDRRVHRETYKGFKLEVWQVKESIGTANKRFYSLRWNLAVKKATPSRADSFESIERALSFTQRKIDRRRYIIDHHPKAKTRRVKEQTPAKIEPEIIEAITGETDFPIPSRILGAYDEFHRDTVERETDFYERAS